LTPQYQNLSSALLGKPLHIATPLHPSLTSIISRPPSHVFSRTQPLTVLGARAHPACSVVVHGQPKTPLYVPSVLPELVVFDLDDCLWSPEMYELSEIPRKVEIGKLGECDEGVIAVWSGNDKIKLYPGALRALQEFYLDMHPGMRIAAASSANTPLAEKIGRTAMGMLEVLPGVTAREVFAKGWQDGFEGNLQIGRQPPLSPDKSATHFPFLRKATGIDYKKMLYFDDCNWDDHCGKVAAKHSVIGVRTPFGLQKESWVKGLKAYESKQR